MFTYNDWSAGTEYDYMVKAAVTSGIEVARMKPYCMYSGSTSAEMYQWFLSKGVTIIQVGACGALCGQPTLHHNAALLAITGCATLTTAAHASLEGCLGTGGCTQPGVQHQGETTPASS